MLTGKKIILGVTGSIAAYKAALLVRLFVKAGAEVRVILTEGARHFVTDLTFSNLSQKPVFTSLWEGEWTEHVHLGAWGDAMVVAPCTANTLAKMSQGICDNALLAVYLSAKCPVFVAPAMDADMWAHSATQDNVERVQAQGLHLIAPGEGFLASGQEGAGRMAEPEDILAAVAALLGPPSLPLHGRKILVSAGPTREPIDPVRFLSNHSSGSMGYAIASEAKRLGAEVTLVSGPVDLDSPEGIDVVQVGTAEEMAKAIWEAAPAQQVIVMAAAVADYKPAQISEQKIKKQEGEMRIELSRTPDILAGLGPRPTSGQIRVGFALETEKGEENALDKLRRKDLDYIVLNILGEAGAGFGPGTNKISIIDKNGDVERYPVKAKKEVAADIWRRIIKDM